nr:MAG TPA: acriflavine resistance protein B [Caudoviricetes sp.]
MWGAFFSWGVPMFVIGCMAGYAFRPKRRKAK